MKCNDDNYMYNDDLMNEDCTLTESERDIDVRDTQILMRMTGFDENQDMVEAEEVKERPSVSRFLLEEFGKRDEKSVTNTDTVSIS